MPVAEGWWQRGWSLRWAGSWGTRSCPCWFLPFVTEKEKEKSVCGDLVEKFLSRVVLSEEDRPDITALVDLA